MIFRVGQKVVCIDDRWTTGILTHYVIHKPSKGHIYTIRALTIGWPYFGSIPSMMLEEIVNPPDALFSAGEAAFSRTHFRPVIERKTDISAFTSLLTPNKQTENA